MKHFLAAVVIVEGIILGGLLYGQQQQSLALKEAETATAIQFRDAMQKLRHEGAESFKDWDNVKWEADGIVACSCCG